MTSKEALEKIGKYYMYEEGSEFPLNLENEKEYKIIKQDLEVLEILKEKEVDVNFFKTLIPFHKGEELMMKYNLTRWKGKLTLEETIKIKEWLDGKIKLLLYCTKQPLYLVRNESDGYFYTMDKGTLNDYKNVMTYNGKIVAECDFEVEEIYFEDNTDIAIGSFYEGFLTDTLSEEDLCKKSCLTEEQLYGYLESGTGYAIHIKNLNIFDKPRELEDYDRINKEDCFEVVHNAPQNMMKICERMNEKEKYILISIRPEWLCKILNGEKTIEVRRKVMKEMMQDG